jgi:hypothetical protein
MGIDIMEAERRGMTIEQAKRAEERERTRGEASVATAERTPEELGWIRAPQHDQHGGKAWVMPNGEIHVFAPHVRNVLVHLERD